MTCDPVHACRLSIPIDTHHRVSFYSLVMNCSEIYLVARLVDTLINNAWYGKYCSNFGVRFRHYYIFFVHHHHKVMMCCMNGHSGSQFYRWTRRNSTISSFQKKYLYFFVFFTVPVCSCPIPIKPRHNICIKFFSRKRERERAIGIEPDRTGTE